MKIGNLAAHQPIWIHTWRWARGFDYEDDEGEVQFRDGVQSAEITSLGGTCFFRFVVASTRNRHGEEEAVKKARWTSKH